MIGKARAVKLEQQLAVLGVGVVVPAQAVVAEGHAAAMTVDERDDANGSPVGNAIADRMPTKWQLIGSRRWSHVYLLAAPNISSTCSQFTRWSRNALR